MCSFFYLLSKLEASDHLTPVANHRRHSRPSNCLHVKINRYHPRKKTTEHRNLGKCRELIISPIADGDGWHGDVITIFSPPQQCHKACFFGSADPEKKTNKLPFPGSQKMAISKGGTRGQKIHLYTLKLLEYDTAYTETNLQTSLQSLFTQLFLL